MECTALVLCAYATEEIIKVSRDGGRAIGEWKRRRT